MMIFAPVVVAALLSAEQHRHILCSHLTNQLSDPHVWNGDQAALCRYLELVAIYKHPQHLRLLVSHIGHRDQRCLFNRLVPPETTFPVIVAIRAYGLDAVQPLLAVIRTHDATRGIDASSHVPHVAVRALTGLLDNRSIGIMYTRWLLRREMNTATHFQRRNLEAALTSHYLRYSGLGPE